MKTRILTLLLAAIALNVNAQLSAPDQLPTSIGNLTIQPVMHASLVLTINGKTIYVDPAGGTANFAGLAAPDLILITDIHGDHFDIKTLDSLKKGNTVLNCLPAINPCR
jgi:L-ascorbate metabolism protein UlaG (beta-lactamase superfamily)